MRSSESFLRPIHEYLPYEIALTEKNRSMTPFPSSSTKKKKKHEVSLSNKKRRKYSV